jgi:hypothetical protein
MQEYGVHMFFVASEQSWMLAGARDAAAGIRALDDT